jgi:hypothetical protein
VDCYRFYPDAFRALARYTKCHLLDVWLDERGQWRDLVGVFSKNESPPMKIALPSTGLHQTLPQAVDHNDSERLDVLRMAHKILRPSLYLEVGVGSGESLLLATGSAIGINSHQDSVRALPKTVSLVSMTSDDFFDRPPAHLKDVRPDLVLLNDQSYEHALRDFMNVERRSAPGCLVIFSNIFPPQPNRPPPLPQPDIKPGDVWRLLACLRGERPDLFVVPVDTSSGGLLLVAGLNPANQVLWQRYNGLFQRYHANQGSLPPEIHARDGALSSHDPLIAELFDLLFVLREKKSPPGVIVTRLRAVRGARKVA